MTDPSTRRKLARLGLFGLVTVSYFHGAFTSAFWDILGIRANHH